MEDVEFFEQRGFLGLSLRYPAATEKELKWKWRDRVRKQKVKDAAINEPKRKQRSRRSSFSGRRCKLVKRQQPIKRPESKLHAL